MKTETEYFVISEEESVLESIAKDTITFGFLLFCMWVSRGSRAWTVVCGLMFFTFLCGKLAVAFGTRTRRFKTKEELAAWLNKQS